MKPHPLAGKQVPQKLLANIPKLVSSYYSLHPDAAKPEERVSFGTSGHRGNPFQKTFNEDHMLSIIQAICEYRKLKGINGPLFVGMDTHALSEAAHTTTLEVLAAHEVDVMIQEGSGYTPTPVISHAILTYNRQHRKHDGIADGIVITPSHNPPDNGGVKYNPPNGGPADIDVTQWIAARANKLLESVKSIKRISYERAIRATTTHAYDYIKPYVEDIHNVIDIDAIKSEGLLIGADAMGGSGFAFWDPIADVYNLNIDVTHGFPDPTFSFMTVDKDGKIRMDCSSPYAMASLIKLKDRYDIAFGNDPDFDRHGIVTPSAGLMNPNHYLSVAIWYLFQNRAVWTTDTVIGKTLVSSLMIDKVAAHLGRRVAEVPVGFKWFVNGLLDGSYGFGGEESAGASFLRQNGTVWTTDKDGFIMDLLAAEITAKTGRDPAEHYQHLTELFGTPVYERIDAPATPQQKALLARLSPKQVEATKLGGEKIIAILTDAPANHAPINGLKVITPNAWFAARPSGTEDVYKIYAESFKGKDHLAQIQNEAQLLIEKVLSKTP